MPTVISCFETGADTPPPANLAPSAERLLVHATDSPASYGWIDIAQHDEPAAAAAVATARAAGARSGSYAVHHIGEVPAPPYSTDGTTSSVLFVNCFVFDPSDADAALEIWRRVNAYMVNKPGYRWHRLHLRLDDDAPFGFVNLVEWESQQAWAAAHDAGFRAVAGRPDDLPFRNFPTIGTPAQRRTLRAAASGERHAGRRGTTTAVTT
jgi:heme-degrading monooxygenase HmoA